MLDLPDHLYKGVNQPSHVGPTYHRPLKITCNERCLRLAYKHSVQQLDANSIDCFEAFLIGTLEVDEDESGLTIRFDRFDPGSTVDGCIEPSVVLPTDVVMPINFSYRPQNSSIPYTFSCEHFTRAFRSLSYHIQSQTVLNLSSYVKLRMNFYVDPNSIEHRNSQLQLTSVAVNMSSNLQVTPVKQIPIIPIALAKSLSLRSGANIEFKTGYASIDPTRKILLMLSSDPKVKVMPVCGIWISGVNRIHHPFVWYSALRFLSCKAFNNRVLSTRDEFFIILYSKTESQPTFFKCNLLNPDESVSYNMSYADCYINESDLENSSNPLTLLYDSLPTEDTQDSDHFVEALKQVSSQCEINENVVSESSSVLSSEGPRRRNEVDESLPSTTKKNDLEPRSFSITPTTLLTSSFLSTSPIMEPSLLFSESFEITDNEHHAENVKPKPILKTTQPRTI